VSLWLLHTNFFSIFLTFHRAVSFYCCVKLCMCVSARCCLMGVVTKGIIIKFWRPHSGAPNGPPIGYLISRPFVCGGEMPISVKIQGFTPYPDVCQMCVVQKEIDTCLEPRRGSFKTFRRKSETCERQYGAPVYGYYTVKNSHWKR